MNNSQCLFCRIESERDSLQQQLAAAQEEIEFQRTAHNRAMELMLEQGQQLAAVQADNARLRDKVFRGLGSIEGVTCAPDGSVCCTFSSGPSADLFALQEGLETIRQALSTQSDTSALEALITKAGEVMRDKALMECATWDDVATVQHAIRALPGVTLKDLSSG